MCYEIFKLELKIQIIWTIHGRPKGRLQLVMAIQLKKMTKNDGTC